MGKEYRVAISICVIITIIILIHAAIPSKNNNYDSQLSSNNSTQYISSGNTIYNDININQFYRLPITYEKSIKINGMMMGFNAGIPKNGINVYAEPVKANINIQTGEFPK